MVARVVAAIALGVLARSADAQADVTRIVGANGSALDSTSDVLLTRFGAVRAGSIKLTAKLKAGDELRSAGGITQVVLQCPDSAEVMLEGQFRAVVMRGGPGKSCFFSLLAGKAHVTGDTTTGLGLGDVTLGAIRTRYAVTVTNLRDSVQRDVEVFDGEVELERTAGTRPITVRAGRWIPLEGTIESQQISSSRIRAAAALYARIDASKVDSARRPLAAESLTVRYEEVLANPDRPEARLKLVEKQVQLNATGNNTMYELKRARATAPRGSDVEPATAALSVAVYTQLGRNELIPSQLTTLRSFDAPTIDRALRQYNINPEVVNSAGRLNERLGRLAVPRDSLRVRVTAQPVIARARQRTVITVTITGPAGAIAGATVAMKADGGAFASSGLTVTGTTNSDGIFTTAWSCTTCTQSYLLNVDATRAGFIAGTATLTVRVR